MDTETALESPTERALEEAGVSPEEAPAPCIEDLAKEQIANQDAETPMAAALRLELRGVLDKPLTIKTCKQLIRLAQASGSLLRALGGTPPLRDRSGLRVVPAATEFGMDYDDMQDFGAVQDLGGSMSGIVMPNQETYGANAMRELVAALKGTREPGIEKLVQAYGNAKDAGLDEEAEKIKARINAQLELSDELESPTSRALRPQPLSIISEDPVDVDLPSQPASGQEAQP